MEPHVEPEPPTPERKKKVLVVTENHVAGGETFANFLKHSYGEKIDFVTAHDFETASPLLFPEFDIEAAEAHMKQIELPRGAWFDIRRNRYGHRVFVYDADGKRLDFRDTEHVSIGLAADSIERKYRRAPFDAMITEETIPLKPAKATVRHYFGHTLVSIAQMAMVPKIGILIPKGGQEVPHFLGDVFCGDKRLVCCFKEADWPFISRDIIGM